MWKRSNLKKNAKRILKINYWKAFLVSLVLAIVGGSGSYSYNTQMGTSFNSSSNQLNSIPHWMIATIVGTIIIAILISLAVRIFLGYALEVGGRKYFIQSAQEDFDMNYLGYIFNKLRYMDVVKAMLWRALFNILWYLLFIIPGIIKYYAYRMVPYILADNPNIGYKRALKLSMQMTRGNKFRIFILDLSFIGWLLLGTLALCVGVLFVLPYINATNAELYLTLRSNALEQGICSLEELLLEPIE
jgi:Predicted integral membrane protein